MTHRQDGLPFMPGPLSEKQIENKLKWAHNTVAKKCSELIDLVSCLVGGCKEEREIIELTAKIIRLSDQACYNQRKLED